MRSTLCVVVASLWLSTSASAALINGVRVDHVSSELRGNFDRVAAHVVDGSGLNTVTGFHSVIPDGTMWLNISSSGVFPSLKYEGTALSNAVDESPEITVDLGAKYNLNSVRVWNYNENSPPNLTSRGINQALISISDNNANYTPLGVVNLSQAPGVNNVDFSQVFAAPVAARFVKLEALSNHGSAEGFVGLSEVQFDGSLSTAVNQIVVTGVTANASSQLAFGPFDRAASRVVDGSGFNPVTGSHSNALEGVHWLSTGNGAAGGGADNNPQITFDLGSVKPVTQVQIWNYNEQDTGGVAYRSRGVNDVTVQVSNDGVLYTTLFSTNLFAAPGLAGIDYHQTLVLDTAARYVRFTNLTSHGGDNNFVGLSEVRFFQVAPVPEPASLSLLLLGGAGLIARRRVHR